MRNFLISFISDITKLYVCLWNNLWYSNVAVMNIKRFFKMNLHFNFVFYVQLIKY